MRAISGAAPYPVSPRPREEKQPCFSRRLTHLFEPRQTPPPYVGLRPVRDIAFHIGPLAVHWFGVMLAAGFLAAFWTAARRAPSAGINSEVVYDLVPWLVIGTIIGARAVYVTEYWQEEFAGRPWTAVFAIRQGGLVFYGGFIGACVGTILFSRRKNAPLWKLADVTAPSIALGQVFGRIGCLMHGCCYGKACDLPWAVHFPKDHITRGAGVHPTQIYEAALSLALSGILMWQFKRRRFDGQVFAFYLIGYAVLRTLVEFFRGDYPQSHVATGLTSGQLVSVGILAAGLLLLWKLPRLNKAQAV